MPEKDNLDEYKKKRDFNKTGEPEGGSKKPGDKPVFVIQKHQATNLHYDLRLEVDGVLKSWAVPKGPSVDPLVKRLAIPTEDHPLDYANFEGVIPEGEYGAGTVLVWDTGTYRNIRKEKKEDGATMDESLQEGKVEVYLEGERLQGGFVLIRTGSGDNIRWLLIKMSDDYADHSKKPVESETTSVLTGRNLEEIAEEG